jgi:hypothetical protein
MYPKTLYGITEIACVVLYKPELPLLTLKDPRLDDVAIMIAIYTCSEIE